MLKMFACANLSFLFKERGPLLTRYKAAADAGFKYVECDFPSDATPDELNNAVAKNGLKQMLINCFQGSFQRSKFVNESKKFFF